MSRRKGKRDLVELRGVSSTYTREASIVNQFVDSSICRIRRNNFYYDGKIDGEKYSFKINTDSDVF